MFGRVGVLLLAAWLLVFGGVEVFAQQPSEVTYTGIISFGSIFDTIRTQIAPIVAGAIGLGLAIWGARYLFKVFKGMSH
ncbi:MAG: hypothetical protein LBH00_10580 [Planctomycetaceae bacterium]|jgi:uncharacterized membrane protein|nr:hypothetical protein [Planctomycetaceae bacterium]